MDDQSSCMRIQASALQNIFCLAIGEFHATFPGNCHDPGARAGDHFRDGDLLAGADLDAGSRADGLFAAAAVT